MTQQQLLALFLVVVGAGILGTVCWRGAYQATVTTAPGANGQVVTLPASSAIDPLVPALAAQVLGDPFVQRMVGQRRGTSIPLPPPPPVLTPEPPLLPLIGH